MFLTTCLLLAAAGCCNVAAAAGNEQDMRRDLGSIQASLGGVNTALAGLDSAILNDPANPKVLFSSINVLEAIQQATASINASQPLGPADTSNLKATTDSLVSNVNVTVTDLIGQKPLFDRLGLEKVVLLQVQNIQGAALTLASTLASKVDPAASSIALQGINALTTTLQRGVAVSPAAESCSTHARTAQFVITKSSSVKSSAIECSAIKCPAFECPVIGGCFTIKRSSTIKPSTA